MNRPVCYILPPFKDRLTPVSQREGRKSEEVQWQSSGRAVEEHWKCMEVRWKCDGSAWKCIEKVFQGCSGSSRRSSKNVREVREGLHSRMFRKLAPGSRRVRERLALSSLSLPAASSSRCCLSHFQTALDLSQERIEGFLREEQGRPSSLDTSPQSVRHRTSQLG